MASVSNSAKRANIVFRKSYLGELPAIVLFWCLLALSIYLTAYLPWSVQHIPLSEWFTLHLPLFAIFPLVVLIHILHRVYNSRYTIGDDYVRCIHGLLSLMKQDVRIEYRDILGIEIDRNLIDRMVNVGNLRIGTAMLGTQEINFIGVRNPSRYRDIVLKRVREHIGEGGLPHIKHRKPKIVPDQA